MGKKLIALREFLFSVIMLCTAVDVFWSIVVVDTLIYHELNPVASWIIFRGDNGMATLPHSGVALLCGLKIIGTWLAIRCLNALMHYQPRVGWASTAGVAAFMVYLAWFLSF